MGVDLTAIPGVNVMVAQTLLTEIGPDLSRFPNASAFVLSSAVPVPGDHGWQSRPQDTKTEEPSRLGVAARSPSTAS